MTKDEYRFYLRSSHWLATREQAMERDGRWCQFCNHGATEVHHLTYERLGSELPDDLMAVCHECHMGIHSMPHLEEAVSEGYEFIRKGLAPNVVKMVIRMGQIRKENMKVFLEIVEKITRDRASEAA